MLDIYKFACRNYRSHLDLALEAAAAKAENRAERYGPWQSDDIFGFGFSRGGFTIRVVNGLICEQGLVSYGTEEELDRKAALDRPFGRVIIRYGETGNEENFIDGSRSGTSSGREIQGTSRQATVRLFEQTGQRGLPRSLSQRELG